MTEEQAIERIAKAIACNNELDMADRSFARLAWNEIKAIAREDRAVNVMYGSFTLHEDGSKTWHPNPNLPLTAEEQHAHNWPA